MAKTLFERLIAGELPAHVVYQDAHVFAFLDVAPLSWGHILLVPKEPAKTLDALSEESAAALGRVLPKLCAALCRTLGVTDYNVLQNNGAGAHQAVPHVHFHIVPRPHAGVGLNFAWKSQALAAWPEAQQTSPGALAALLAAGLAQPERGGAAPNE